MNEQIQIKTKKKGKAPVELFFLFKYLTPFEITHLNLGYSKSTVYRYYKIWKDAKTKAIQLLKKVRFFNWDEKEIEKLL